tara:strand:+ start:9301 stop:9804 length:504 start_codon:yes stop_codon:yes gene_type:complete
MKGVLNLIRSENPFLISVEGVQRNTGERCDVTQERLELNEYEFYEMRYKIGYAEYCIVSENIPDENLMYLHSEQKYDSPYITKAQVVIGDNSIDVTEKLIQVSGPMCNFHDCPIDFSWIFPQCNGSIHIIFNDTTCEIDIKSNVMIDGDDSHIPLIDYIDEEDVCFE